MSRPGCTTVVLVITLLTIAGGLLEAERFYPLTVAGQPTRSDVTAIGQSSDGFLWLGTRDGLNRYDGRSITVHRRTPNADSGGPGLRDDDITVLFSDHAGSLWIGTRAGGLHVYEPVTRVIAPWSGTVTDATPDGFPLYDGHVTSIAEDETGRLWIGTADGLVMVDEDRQRSVWYRQQQFRDRGIPSNAVTAVAVDSRSCIWVGTADRGIGIYDATGPFGDLTAVGDEWLLQRETITVLTTGIDGEVWIGTDGGRVMVGTNNDGRVHLDEPGRIEAPILSIIPVGDREVWISTDGRGLWRDTATTAPESVTVAGPDSGVLAACSVRAVFRDRSGLIWISAGARGAWFHSPRSEQFELFALPGGNGVGVSNGVGGAVWGFAERDDGRVWIASDAGLFMAEPGSDRIHMTSSVSGPVCGVALNDDSSLWVATRLNGVYHLRPDGELLTHYTASPNGAGLPSNRIMTVVPVDTETVLVGTADHGLAVLDPRTGRSRTIDLRLTEIASSAESSRPTAVYAIVRESESRYWLATDSPHLILVDLETDEVTGHTLSDSTGSNRGQEVWSVTPNHDGTLWIGTREEGAFRYDPDSGRVVQRISPEEIRHGTVYTVVTCAANTAWIVSSTGLYSVTATEVMRFTERDGLPSTELNLNSVLVTRDGWIYAGGVGGFVRFDPDRVHTSTYEPPVVVTDISDGGAAPLPWDSVTSRTSGEHGVMTEISLEWGFRPVVISVAALDYADPSRIEYLYSLERSRPEWVTLARDGSIPYVPLLPRSEKLFVRATNSDGVWTAAPAAVLIRVKPPFWLQPWYFGSALVVVIVLAAVRRQVLSRRYHSMRLPP